MRTAEKNPAYIDIAIQRFDERFDVRSDGDSSHPADDSLAIEEPLEIRIVHGSESSRKVKSISVTMRTPGHDAELAVGFLVTEGVIRDPDEILRVNPAAPGRDAHDYAENEIALSGHKPEDTEPEDAEKARNLVTVELAPTVEVNSTTLERNFYTTSSCGVCGKASLLALRSVCPPRIRNEFTIDAGTLYELPLRLRDRQGVFDRTGGLHAAALFSSEGELDSMREDVGRHNAVDKLIGAAILADRLPLRDRLLLLSGRASFELVQKAVMAGIPMIAAIGAPSSLAVEVAKDFDITLIGFLRGRYFNVYHGAQRVIAGDRHASIQRT